LDIAGVQREDIKITVATGMLEVTGTRRGAFEQQGRQLRMSERPLGFFRRVFVLPQICDVTAVAAQFSDGVLSIRVPRTPEKESVPRQVAIG
jgi:HSP20 family protein